MKSFTCCALLLGHLFLITAFPAWADSDNFDDNLKDPAKWGDDMLVGEGTNAVLTEIRGHLEFTGSTDGNGDSTVLCPWIGDVVSYTQNWEAAVDLHTGFLDMPLWSGLQMFMAVVAEGNIGNRVVMGLSADKSQSGLVERFYEWSSAVADQELMAPPHAGDVSTGDFGGRIRVAFDASTKTLHGSYNGIPLGSIDVDAAETSWGMSTGSTFAVFLGGSIWDSFTNNSSEVYADNFEFRSGDDLTYALTVQYGSGSGVYTNNAKISITASNAPSEWVFDRWVGSTQSVANATSTTTTVTMPAHAIALTPSYKLSGIPSSDDFDDNSKDASKWGEDIQFGIRGALTEANQRVEFLVSSNAWSEGNVVTRPWNESFGHYDQSWEASVDAHLGTIPASVNYMNANLNLAVFNMGDPTQINGMPADHFLIALNESQEEQEGRERYYEVTSIVDGTEAAFPGAVSLVTADFDGRVKISFDATSKILRASCNGSVLGWLSATNWNMSDSDTFGFALIAAVNNNSNAIPSGEMFFDNFEVVGAMVAPDFTYTTNGGNITITGYLGSGGAVTVPDTIEALPVTTIATGAFDGHTALTSIVIPASVTHIEDYAFNGCANLKALSFDGNAPSLGSSAFSGLTASVIYRVAGTSGWSEKLGTLAVKTLYPVATAGAVMGAAWDGTNYLIGVESHQTATNMIGAQRLSADGAKLGSWIETGRSGIATAIAFDGTNYLMVWEDDGLGTLNGTTGWQIYGQRISRAGTKVGSPIALTSVGVWFDGMNVMAYGGGKYLVTYTRLINPALGDQSPTNRYIAGRIVSPSGIVGTEFRISTFYGTASEVAFDGSNFLVAWREDENDCEIRGRFVSPSGVPGTEISIDFDGDPSDNPIAMVYDGTNYVVAWSDEITGGEWDIFAQKVSKTGEMVGDVVTVCDDPGQQMLTDLAFDGTLYLAVWSDMQNPNDADMAGSYVYSLSGLPGEGSFPLMNAGGNQLGGVNFWNGKYLVVVNDGVIMADGEENSGIDHIDASYVMFITPPTAEDSDADGLPDAWEQQYFGGLDKADNPSATCANGINTLLAAYVAGINPTDPASRFEITNQARNVIQWNAVTGRVYNVYWTTNLLSGFQPLYTNYTGGSITDTVHSAAGKCFYKIDVRLP